MTDQFLAEIRPMPFSFAPREWAFCNGQILAISQFTAIFSLCGTTYGGNGTSNFALPNLQGRVPMHFGQGPGLSQYDLGEAAGNETVTLLSTQMPQHNHQVQTAESATLKAAVPNTTTWLGLATSATYYLNAGGAQPNSSLHPQAIAFTGNNQPHENRQPYLAINFCFAMAGIFPARN